MTRKDPFGGSLLVDDNQQIHVMICDPVAAAPSCPTDYQWTNTGDQKVWIAQKVTVITDEEEGFCNLPPYKILPATSDNVQLEYALNSLGKRVQAQTADQ